MSVVEKGDWISVNAENKEEAVVKWQQNLANKQASYIVVPYVTIGKEDNAGGPLFIQATYLDRFYALCEEQKNDNPFKIGASYKVQISSEFQYGQNNEKTFRFLVFHNKANKPFQHRFTTTTAFGNILIKLSDTLKDAASWIFGDGIASVVDFGKGFIGDYLRDF